MAAHQGYFKETLQMKRLTMAAALLLVALTAQAEGESQFRVGAAAAFTDYKGDSSFPIEDSGLGAIFYAQARLSKMFAVEIGYFNSGGFKQDLKDAAPEITDGPAEIRMGGFNISAIGYLPVFQESETDIDLFAKVGLYDYDVDLSTANGASTVPTALGHDTGVLVGAGFVLNVSDSVGIRTSFDWVNMDNADLWALGLGAEFRF
jgi:hypothetical protein